MSKLPEKNMIQHYHDMMSPGDVFQAMAEEGILRIPFGNQFGGDGLQYPVMSTAVAVEELSYHSNSYE